MGFKAEVNRIRRSIMHGLTRNVGRHYSEAEMGLEKLLEVKKVLIVRPNHRLGNQLLLTPLVQEVINTFPNCKIDLFVKGGVASIVFKNYTQVEKIIQLPRKPFNNLFKYASAWFSIKRRRYDLVINADRNSSSGRLLTQLSNAKYKVFGDWYEGVEMQYSDYKHTSKSPIYNLRTYLSKFNCDNIQKDMPLLNLALNDAEKTEGKKILDDLVKNDKKTICIYTNATGDKCYSESWWEAFYARLQKEYPNYNIIEMLPIENISKISFKAPTFYSKDIREMGGIIHNTAVFIAADNGVMHLASGAFTPTIGFFSITNLNVYGPYGNKSIAIDTNTTTSDYWFEKLHNILG